MEETDETKIFTWGFVELEQMPGCNARHEPNVTYDTRSQPLVQQTSQQALNGQLQVSDQYADEQHTTKCVSSVIRPE